MVYYWRGPRSVAHYASAAFGPIVQTSSVASIADQEFVSAYSASKFSVEGWIESLTAGVAPLGIRTMLVEPCFFRTELLSPESTNFAKSSIDDYTEKTKETVAAWPIKHDGSTFLLSTDYCNATLGRLS